MYFGVIILAAGNSRRFGSNKLVHLIKDKTILEWSIEPYKEYKNISTIIVVTSPKSTIITGMDEDTIIKVINKNTELGMIESIKCGIETLMKLKSNIEGVFIQLGDMPYITDRDLITMMQQYLKSRSKILIPKFNGKNGHPVFIHKSLFHDLLGINNLNDGLRGFIKSRLSQVNYVNVDNIGILKDIDTKNDL